MGCKRVLLLQRYDFYLSCARILREKCGIGGDFLTDVGCFEMQNAASANQSGLSTNHIGRFGGLDVILQRSLVLHPK